MDQLSMFPELEVKIEEQPRRTDRSENKRLVRGLHRLVRELRKTDEGRRVVDDLIIPLLRGEDIHLTRQ